MPNKKNSWGKDKRFAERAGGRVIAPGLIRIDRCLPLASTHGSVSLVGACQRVAFSAAHQHFQVEDYLFFDTETTGLAGGTGTLAFMVGLGWVEGDELRIRQYVISRFCAEEAMLEALQPIFEAARCLVSFNGKSFDAPLLTTRFQLKSLTSVFESKPHLDLLHPVRRAYRQRWDNCRLISAEEKLLNFRRENDLPGAEAPEAWLRYLREGHMYKLLDIAEHNYWDIVSLVALIPALNQSYRIPELVGADAGAVAAFHVQHGDRVSALAVLEKNKPQLDHKALHLLARLYRYKKRWAEAIMIWRGLATDGCAHSAEQLSKYYEHVGKDYQQARRYAKCLPMGIERDRRIQRVSKALQQGQLAF